MKKIFYFLVIMVGLAVFATTGCGQKNPADSIATPASETPAVSEAPSSAAKTVEASTTGTLTGKVLFEGQAPAPQELGVRGNPECAALHPGGKILSEELLVKDGALQNVFVYIKEGLEGYEFPAPSEAVVVSNTKCVYVPHVSGAMVNQPIGLMNNDATLHNVHSFSKNSKGWNLGLPFQGMKQTKKFTASEVMVTLKCDVHPWMLGYLGILPHPYFSVTDADGNFELKNLPPGEYTIEAWHEKLGVRSQKIRIEPQETKEIQFNYKN